MYASTRPLLLTLALLVACDDSEGPASALDGETSTEGTDREGPTAGVAPAPEAETFADLRIASDTASIEFTPVLVAAEDFYKEAWLARSGRRAARSRAELSAFVDPSVAEEALGLQ